VIEMDSVVIDSSVLLSYKEGDLSAKKLIHDAIDESIAISVSAYSLFVLSRSNSFDRKSEIGFSSLLKFINSISLTADMAMKAGYFYRSASLDTNPYGQVDLFNLSEPNLDLVEDSVTCALAQNMGCSVISSRNNLLKDTDIEWIVLEEL